MHLLAHGLLLRGGAAAFRETLASLEALYTEGHVFVW